MHSESDTPIEQRFLWFEGKISLATVERIKSGLPDTRPLNTEIVFVGFSYCNLPFTKRFDIIFPKGKPQEGVRCECQIVAATQQFGKPFPDIPHGWKTICMVHFTGGIPLLVQRLPVVDDWYQNDEWVCVCDETTWEYLKRLI